MSCGQRKIGHVKRCICLPCSFCKYTFFNGPRGSVICTELFHNCFMSFTAWITFKLIFWLSMFIKHKCVVTFYMNIRKLLTKIQNKSGRKVERTYCCPSGSQSQCKANLCLFFKAFESTSAESDTVHVVQDVLPYHNCSLLSSQ